MNAWATEETFYFDGRLSRWADVWARVLEDAAAFQRQRFAPLPGALLRYVTPPRELLEDDRAAHAPIPTTWLARRSWHEWELAVTWEAKRAGAAGNEPGALLQSEAGTFYGTTAAQGDGTSAFLESLVTFYGGAEGFELQPFQRHWLDTLVSAGQPPSFTVQRGRRSGPPPVPAMPDSSDARAWALDVLQNDVGVCLCEDPEPSVALVGRVLWLMRVSLSEVVTAHELELAAGSAAAGRLILGQLHEAGLLDHGHHCLTSWLTPKGRRLLEVLAANAPGAIVDAPRSVPSVCGYCFHPAGTLHADDCSLIGPVYS